MNGNSALAQIRKHFPQVLRVRDAKATITVQVKPIDTKTGRKKDPAGCALVKACKRENIADGAIIGVGNSWLISGTTAIRYKTSTAVGREIVSFDRHGEFAAGADYKLSKIAPSMRLGKRTPYKCGPRLTKRHSTHRVHRTANIRVLK